MVEHINKLFVAVIVISLFTYFERADYNLPLFVFTLFLWDHPKPVTSSLIADTEIKAVVPHLILTAGRLHLDRILEHLLEP